MAKHSRDYYWTDKQRAWVKDYTNEINEILKDYQTKMDELKEVRREVVSKILMLSRIFRDYEPSVQKVVIDAINDIHFERIKESDDKFIDNEYDIDPPNL